MKKEKEKYCRRSAQLARKDVAAVYYRNEKQIVHNTQKEPCAKIIIVK